MSFRLETMYICRMVHASDDTASKLRSVVRLSPPQYEVLDFSCMKSPLEISMSSYFFWNQIPMLLTPSIDGSLYLFYARNICHLDSLLGPIQNIVNFILSGWTTHITIFFTIAVAAINLTNALSSQNWLDIPPSNFFLLIDLPQNQVVIRIIVFQFMR